MFHFRQLYYEINETTRNQYDQMSSLYVDDILLSDIVPVIGQNDQR